MEIHILGNGPSIELYTPQDSFVVGCNFQKHRCDINVVVDCRPFLVYAGNRELLPNRKLITSRYAIQTIKEIGIYDEFEYVHVIDYLEKYISAGHIAVNWALSNKYNKIHLWGFDSIWADTLETKTDALVERNRLELDLYVHWREKWQPYKTHNIIVHNTTEGTQLKELL